MDEKQFPSSNAFERLLFRRDGTVVGFAVLLVPKPEDVKISMGANIVTLVDFCTFTGDLPETAAALTQWLWGQDLDAVIFNHSHGPTLDVLKATGFRPRATNMYLATSPLLQEQLDADGIGLDQMIVSRADGDGPIGLGVNL
jgi:hypothetical protein